MNTPRALQCGEVMPLLDDYVDGTITAEAKSQVDLHLEGCDACERFGGAYAAIVKTIKGKREVELSRERASRLDAALKARL